MNMDMILRYASIGVTFMMFFIGYCVVGLSTLFLFINSVDWMFRNSSVLPAVLIVVLLGWAAVIGALVGLLKQLDLKWIEKVFL